MAGASTTLSRWGSWIEQHPYATAGIVFVSGAILIYLYYSGGSAPQQASGDATSAQYLQAQLQSEDIQAQLSANLGAQQAQEQSVATQVNGQVSIAQLQAGVANQQTAATQAVDLSQIAASKAVNLSQISAAQAVNLAQISAQTTQSGQLYGYLNNQAELQYANNQNWISAFASAFLSNQQYNALEGQLGTQGSQLTNLSGALSGLSGTVSGLSGTVANQTAQLNSATSALNQTNTFLNQGVANIYHFNPNLPVAA
jgi:hypothetical protein